MINNISFRSKMIFGILPMVVLGMLAIGLGGYYQAGRVIMDTQKADMTLLTKQIRNEMTEWVRGCSREADLLTHVPCILDACLGDMTKARMILNQYQEHSPQYEAMWLAGPDGKIFLDSIGGGAVGLEVSKMPLFNENIRLANQGRPAFSEVGRSPATNLPVLLMTAPIEHDGRVVGVIGLSINLNHFSENFISKIKVGKNGYAWMVNQTGMIIAHPDTEYILELDTSEFEFGRRIIGEKAGNLFYEWNGFEKIAFFETDEAMGWSVVVSPVPEDFLNPLKILRNKLLVVGLGVVLLAGLVVILISNILAKSIQKVVGVLNRMSEGDLSLRLGTGRKDEIGRMYQALDVTSQRLDEKVKVAQNISAGDISHEVEPASDHDHLGFALKDMVVSLRTMLDSVSSAAIQISSESQQIAESSQSLSQGAGEQASSLEEITSSVMEIESQTRQTVGNASAVSREVVAVRSWAQTGSGEMKELVTAMEEIDGSANDVSTIIKTIDDLAFQTNLLALNAAVEAARAGKYGKGFAVVAREVKSLAEKSTQAAHQTESLIRDVLEKVDAGTQAVDRTANALNEIVTGVSKVSGLVEDISRASRDQAGGIEEISKGLAQVEQVIHQNTANSEQGAAAAEELSGQSRELMVLLQRFKLKAGDSGSEPALSGHEMVPLELTGGFTPGMNPSLMTENPMITYQGIK